MKSKIYETQKINFKVMRRIITMCIVLIMTTSVFAQSPEKFSYQAVVRDSNDDLVTNQSVGIQIEILSGSTTGNVEYEETHKLTTNANGLASLEIGAGNVVSGIFGNLDWGSDDFFIRSSIDPQGGTNYTITHTNQLLSVPYAEHAASLNTTKDVKIDAEVHTPERTGEANMLPIAYGMVLNDGSVGANSGNFTVSKGVEGEYNISIDGENYYYIDYVVNTSIATEGSVRATSQGGKLKVFTYDVDDTPIDKPFYFVVFKP